MNTNNKISKLTTNKSPNFGRPSVRTLLTIIDRGSCNDVVRHLRSDTLLTNEEVECIAHHLWDIDYEKATKLEIAIWRAQHSHAIDKTSRLFLII